MPVLALVSPGAQAPRVPVAYLYPCCAVAIGDVLGGLLARRSWYARVGGEVLKLVLDLGHGERYCSGHLQRAHDHVVVRWQASIEVKGDVLGRHVVSYGPQPVCCLEHGCDVLRHVGEVLQLGTSDLFLESVSCGSRVFEELASYPA